MNPGTEIDGANGDRLPGMQSPVVERGLMVAHREDRGRVAEVQVRCQVRVLFIQTYDEATMGARTAGVDAR